MSVIVEAGVTSRVGTVPKPLQVRVATDVAEIADVWDALDAHGGGSVYQSRRFLQPWIEHEAAALGIEPRLGVVCDIDGEPIALLPFGAKRRGPLRTLIYLGGRDANLQLPLVQPHRGLSQHEGRELLRLFAASTTPRPDLFILVNQPRQWNGLANPLAFASAFPSPSAAFGDTLGGDIDAFLARHDSRDARKKLRSKAAKLSSLGDVAFAQAPAEQASEIVSTFIAQKTARLAARGIHGGLDDDAVRAFLTAIARASTLELYTLRVEGALAAIFGGLPHGRHWHGLINSYTDDPAIARCSPGDLLLRHVLGDLVRRDFATFDLGIGEARYKAALCDERIELVDTIVPVTALGHAFAAAEWTRLTAKRHIKQTPWALRLVRRVQALAGTRRAV